MINTLPHKIGAAIWRSLDPETKWHLIQVNAAVLSKAAIRGISRNRNKIAFVVLTGTILGAFMLFRKKLLLKGDKCLGDA